ncbi:MAG TPA: MFS transporter [Candidatus Eremiobacteraceae bacterium]|jgi:ACS family D-galactonate transporter-like MFS transporter|nr:MFS transporter [Candidatus Eremiobacteraceae bacterium]
MNPSPVAPSPPASRPGGATQPSKLSPALFGVALLLSVSVLINYVDRGTLAIAAPLLKEDLHLSPSQLGVLLSAFFWTYAFCQILSGWLVDRFDVNRLLALGVLLWSLATLGTGLTRGFTMLLSARLILGIGESVAYPSYNKIIAKHFNAEHRGRANGLISAGWAGGPAIGTLVGGLLVAHIGWRWFFVVLGAASLLWLPAWLRWMPRGPGLIESEAKHPAGIPEILRQRSAWGTFIGLFSFNYLWYFLITWLPFYLVKQRGFSLQTMSLVGSSAFFALAISVLICGWLADRWIASSGNATLVLKFFCGGGLAISSIAFLAVFLIHNHTIAMGILIFSCVALGMCSPNLWTMTQILAGAQTAGRWAGLENFCGNLAGILGPLLVGVIVDRTGEFFWAFAMTSAVSLLGAAGYIFVVTRVEPVQWVGG